MAFVDKEKTDNPDKIGIIAGNGNFPILCAKEASKKGAKVIAIGIRGETEPLLEELADRFFWINLGELTKLIDCLKSEGVTKALMVGQIKHVSIFKQLSLDLKAISLMMKLNNKKADSLLGGVVKILEDEGIKILPSTTFLTHLLPPKGILTQKTPSKTIQKDISFGTEIAKGIARLDIGQTVVVKNRSVVAVEAMEGTDETIKRAGIIGGKGIVVVKVSKPKQDIRFDVPVIGLKTIQTMADACASAMAIDAEKTLFFDQEEALSIANQHHICIMAQ